MQISLNRPQSLAHQVLKPGNSVCIPWGRGIGKSWFEREVWYENVCRLDGTVREGRSEDGIRFRQRGVRIVHLMPTFKACKDVHQEKVEEELLALDAPWSFLRPKVDRTRWHFSFPGGSWIQWFGAREANATRGLRCDIVTIDECDDIDPEVVDGIVKPWFSEPWSLGIVLYGGTPRRGRYGLLYREHKRGVDKRPKCYSFHATYKDAPGTVSPDRVEEARESTTPAVFKREWECDFDSSEGLVYPMFSEAFHVREPRWDTQWTEIIVGCDWGWEDPGVFVVFGVIGSGRDAVCWAIDEVYQQHRTIDWWTEQAKLIEQRFPNAKWYGDPSRPDNIETLRKNAKVRIEPGDNAIEAGVSSVANRMVIRQTDPEDDKTKFARFYVSARCKNLIREMGAYKRKRDPRNPDRILDEIQDGSDHACDASRYACFTRFGGQSKGMSTEGSGWT